jgi:hypothetical protein
MRATMALIGTALAFSSLACGERVDSTDVRTHGIYAAMRALAEGNGQTAVTADLRVGGSGSNTHLDLKGSDELVAWAATGQSQKMSKVKPDALAEYYIYKASLAIEAGEIVVAFNRGLDDTSAPNSRVTLPDPFTIAGLAPGQEVSRAQGVTMTWAASPAGGNMRWERSGCLRGAGTIPDAGSLTLDPASLALPIVDAGAPVTRPLDAGALDAATFDAGAPDAGPTSCAAQVCLERDRSGMVDPAFGEGGSFSATQRRCVAFNLIP